NAGLQPAVVLKPDRDNDTSVIRGPAIRKAGWLNSNGAVKHTAACEKSYISGGIRKSTEKPYFQKALPGAVSG
uniref:toxin n=1 Tax=Enterocloster clostridioformis TaxID=1531 RepID=UPI003AB72D6E